MNSDQEYEIKKSMLDIVESGENPDDLDLLFSYVDNGLSPISITYIMELSDGAVLGIHACFRSNYIIDLYFNSSKIIKVITKGSGRSVPLKYTALEKAIYEHFFELSGS